VLTQLLWYRPDETVPLLPPLLFSVLVSCLASIVRIAAVDFFNEVNLLFSLVEDQLSDEKFPSMTAGPKYEYFWQDDDKYPRPTKLPARQYIRHLITWIDSQTNNPAIFPTGTDGSFPADFEEVVRRIFKRMFRVYAHIYYHHWDYIRSMGADAHLNTCFKHFVFFVQRFELVAKEELEPLDELISSFMTDETKGDEGKPEGASASASSSSTS
jgi:MOB kinase activator 1